MRPKLLAALTVAALASTLAAAVPTPASARTTTPALAWGDCPPAPTPRDARLQCTTVSVPLDHRAPDGRTIDIAVSRLATAKPDLRRGVLLVNLGGPGQGGIDAPPYLVATMPAALLDRFDLIGFDPRGVGASAPISCGFAAEVPVEIHQRFPDTDGSIDRNVAYARDLAGRCAANGGDTMPHITTANTARDMDLIRAALGEDRISYLGYSYGTYLGAVYRNLFPRRADRFLLDSLDDPTRFGYGQFQLTSLAAALRLPDFLSWAAARDDRYGLGSSRAAVRRTYRALTARLDTTPVPLPDGTVLTGNVLRGFTYESTFSDAMFPALARAWQDIAAGTGPARLPSGAAVAARTALGAQVPADNQASVQAAIHCNDGVWPRDVDTYRRNVALDRRLFPDTAGFPPNIWACAFWRIPELEPSVRVRGIGARNVLLVQNLRDPATPWVGAIGMQRALGSDAVLLSVDQGGHGASFVTASPCTTDTVTAFLAYGTLPAGPRLCPGQELPA